MSRETTFAPEPIRPSRIMTRVRLSPRSKRSALLGLLLASIKQIFLPLSEGGGAVVVELISLE